MQTFKEKSSGFIATRQTNYLTDSQCQLSQASKDQDYLPNQNFKQQQIQKQQRQEETFIPISSIYKKQQKGQRKIGRLIKQFNNVNPEMNKKLNENKQKQYIQQQLPEQAPISQPFINYKFVQQAQEIKNEVQQPQQKQLNEPIKYQQIQPLPLDSRIQLLMNDKQLNTQDLELIFQKYTLRNSTSSQISIKPLFQQFILLKTLQKVFRTENINQVFQILQKCIHFYLTNNIEGIDKIFAATSKIQQIKRFFMLNRFIITIIGFIITINKFQYNRYHLLNLIILSVESLLILLNNFVKSTQLTYISQKYHINILNKGLQQIKIRNDSINRILLIISKTQQAFFNRLNKLAIKCIKLPHNKITLQFLQFLAYEIQSKKYIDGRFLSTSPSPFIVQNAQKYYLVIDALNFTYKSGKGIQFRPFSHKFLKQMSKHFILINYSNWSPLQAHKIMDKFDKETLIKHNLYTHHFDIWPQFKRCINKIGVNKQRIIFLNAAGQNQNQQQICIQRWKGDQKDRQLVLLSEILITISFYKMNCTNIIQKLRESNSDTKKMHQILVNQRK